MPPRAGLIFILSAPSGAGKSTLRQAALGVLTDIHYSVSFTTRDLRAGEENGRDYVFVTVEEFEAGIREGRWAEWARVHGNYYGTSAEVLEQALAAGRDVLLEIDVQGARQGGTDSPEAIARRMENAAVEMAQAGLYRHVIVNDDLQRAIRELIAVIGSHRGQA